MQTGRLCVVLGLSAALAGCGSCGDKKGPLSGEVRAVDGGAELAVGDVTLTLPPDDVAAVGKAVTSDPRGGRVAFDVGAGDARVVHVIGKGAFLGARVKAPVEWSRVPETATALGELFELAGPRCRAGDTCEASPRRAQLVEAVKGEMKERGVVTLLVSGAHVFAPEWDATFGALAAPQADEVRAALAATLEPGKPYGGVARAAMLLPLTEAPHAGKLAARIADLSGVDAPASTPLREARAVGALLRALAKVDAKAAGPLACRVLGQKPLEPPKVSGGEVDLAPRAMLVEAALLAIAKVGAKCEHVAALVSDPCAPALRCAKGKPLTGHETSDQTEPLCTKDELAPAVEAELARPAKDVLLQSSASPPDAWAFAALVAAGAVPEAITLAHDRRRYALTQPKSPECDLSLGEGTPCHCDEATLRDQACRQGGEHLHVAFCKFTADDKKKTLTGVVAASPP